MTVLISGGSGFVGINIAAALLARGRRVVLFGPDAPPRAAEAHLGALAGKLDILAGDVRERGALIEAIRSTGTTHLVHGAAITAALDRERAQARTIAEVNLIGTIEVLEAALTCRIRRVVQLGTGSVHGLVPDHVSAIPETLPAVPVTLYGITKYAAERTALRYRETRGLDLCVARLGVVFGRWEYETGVRDTLSTPFRLNEIAARGGHARIRGGLPDDWVYATDIAEAVAVMLDAPSLPHPLYQIGGGSRWSIAGWCARLARAYPGFTYEFVAPGDESANIGTASPLARPPFAVERLERDFGFRARFGEDEAFSDYIAWHGDRPVGVAGTG